MSGPYEWNTNIVVPALQFCGRKINNTWEKSAIANELSFLQEKGGVDTFTHGPLALKYKLDNEFELLFVVS